MNVGPLFVDTGYWIALVNSGDQFHTQARSWNGRLRDSRAGLVTTEAILLEIGNTFARLRWRSLGTALLEQIRADRRFEIVPLTSDLLSRATALYASRPDKEWGLTDCVSFVVMHERGIMEALAADHHFEQAGFRALLPG